MSAADDRAAMVALLRSGRRPWVEYAGLVEQSGSARAVLQDELQGQAGAGAQTTLLPQRDPDPGLDPDLDLDQLVLAARADLERWDARGMRLVTVLDPAYPPNLRAVHDRPPILFIAGALTPGDENGVALVGARQATRTGVEHARAIAQHLVENDYAVISGLAAGIDTAAHTAALARQGRTVAVIGTGLARSYPPQNARLQRTIADNGAVISQFWPDSPPSRRSFPMRNAVMSGVALATVVVEASETSGARMQARLALAQGRPVFLHAFLVDRQSWAKQYVARPGTHVIDQPAEITTILRRLQSPLVA